MSHREGRSDEEGNNSKALAPLDPSKHYFEVDGHFYGGEFREANEAMELYKQALDEEDKVLALALAPTPDIIACSKPRSLGQAST